MLGKFIVVEGLDGTGKSTFVDRLGEELRNRLYDIVTTRQPGGTPIAEKIRHLIFELDNTNEAENLDSFTEALLFYAARNQLSSALIEPAMKEGKWVISDRHTWSTVAYQGIYDKHIEDLVCATPDLIIYLSAEVGVLLDRIRERGEEPSGYETEESLSLAEERYAKMMRMSDSSKVYIIDTNDFSALDAKFEHHVDEIIRLLATSANV